MKKPNGYWTKERCYELALQCNSRSEFKRKFITPYDNVRKNKWLDDICSHMIKGNLLKRYIYSFEFDDNCVYVGLTCNIKKRISEHTTSNINKKESIVYEHINKTGLTPIIKTLTEIPIDENIAGSVEQIYIDKYLTDGWIILNKRNGGSLGRSIRKWTKITIEKEAIKYNTRIEFYKKSSNAYNSARKHGILNEVCKHMIEMKKPKKYWTKEKYTEEALKYKTRNEFKLKSGTAYEVARKNNDLENISFHMNDIKKPNEYWTKEKYTEEALKYETKSDFHLNSSSAYNAVRRDNNINYVCRHMINKSKYWTKENYTQEALKYKTRNEFQTKSSGAYNAARIDNKLDEICSHMLKRSSIKISKN